MKGGIYSDQRCPECGGRFKHFEPRGMWCPGHPQFMPTKLVVRFGNITRRLKSYDLAYRLLTGLRYETDEGKFDQRDYRTDEPLGFENLTKKFLHTKRNLKAVKKYAQRLRFAVESWHNRNVKQIGYADIEDLFNDLRDDGKSEYYIYHISCTLKMFWSWLVNREEIRPDQMPQKWPKAEQKINLRKIIKKDVQQQVLDEIHRQTWDFNPRIYVAILFLSTYINIRPKELIDIKEKHVEIENTRILIPDPKEGVPKYLNLLDEDARLIQVLSKGFPEMYLFRHEKGNGAAKPGQQFGSGYLYNVWRRACKKLGIEGVPLYPGTRHSTAVDLRQRNTPEAIKRSMGTKSNKAFERYLQITGDEQRKLYQDARSGGVVINLEEIKGQKKS